MTPWQPTAPLSNLRHRAQLLREVRAFFHERQVLEVDTPLLMPNSVTDPYMTALEVHNLGQTYYLQTSPEYAMKRLLCAGIGDIYQLGKNVRAEERGAKHQSEFTLLEWYRVGWDHHQLMDEVFALVSMATGLSKRENYTYQQCFEQYLAFDPLAITTPQLAAIASAKLGQLPADLRHDDYLSLLFATCIEPFLGQGGVAFVSDFPASQASLARLNPEHQTAARFECYCSGLELANGFWELTEATLQRQRFEADNLIRQTLGKPTIAIDEPFLAALEQGLPMCSGVALGFDRLLMLSLGESDIARVVPFAQ